MDSIGRIKKLKALHFGVINVNDRINENICQLINLHYFSIRLADFMDGIDIPNCIGKNSKELRYFELTVSNDNALNSGFITPDIYSLPHIRTIIIVFWPLNTTSFVDFESFNTNTIDNVWFSESTICDNYPGDDNMTYLDFMAQNNSGLGDFIKQFDPCFKPCSNGYFSCTGIDFQNGRCDDHCFDAACGYDNGDCNQLCECGDTLFDGHDICNETCNTENCDWDLFRCVNHSEPCYYNESNPNETCYIGWILDDDSWCDDNCRYRESCLYDARQCRGCLGNCQIIYSMAIEIIASIRDPVTLITMDELCDQWGLIMYVKMHLYVTPLICVLSLYLQSIALLLTI